MWLYALFVIVCMSIKNAYAIGEISKQKCEEYSKAVFSLMDSPVLLPTARKNVISECGIVEVPLIVGGTSASEKEFPHTAIVGFGTSANSEMSWQCGGSLISDQFVLTAAHCMHSREKGPAQKIKFGTNSLTANDGFQEILVSARIPHPQYKPPLKYNDIALIKMVYPVKFTGLVRPACLNTQENLPATKAIATGFGKLFYDSPVGSEILMKVQLSLISNSECAPRFSTGVEKITLPQSITGSMLCAGELSGGKDTCQGDSGGPLQLVLESPYCMYSIIGITSFGKFCGFPNSPAIYTRVSYFVDWIESIVW